MSIPIADQDLINRLRQNIDKATEIHQLVAKFKVHRQDWKTVTVEVYDSGSGNHRYSCVAQAEGYESVTGNPEITIDLAIDMVHWSDLLKHKLPDTNK